MYSLYNPKLSKYFRKFDPTTLTVHWTKDEKCAITFSNQHLADQYLNSHVYLLECYSIKINVSLKYLQIV